MKHLILLGLLAIPGCKTDCRIESQVKPETIAEAPDPFMVEYVRLCAERAAKLQKIFDYDKRAHSDQGPFGRERKSLMARFRVDCGFQPDPLEFLHYSQKRRNAFQKEIEAITSQKNITAQKERELDELQGLVAEIDSESQQLMRSLKAEIANIDSYFRDWDELDRKELALGK